MRGIRAERAAGWFTVLDAEIAYGAVAGGALGRLGTHQREPERIADASVDQLAEANLSLLGVPASDGDSLATLPLSPTDAW